VRIERAGKHARRPSRGVKTASTGRVPAQARPVPNIVVELSPLVEAALAAVIRGFIIISEDIDSTERTRIGKTLMTIGGDTLRQAVTVVHQQKPT
jgi:hypothetical protein